MLDYFKFVIEEGYHLIIVYVFLGWFVYEITKNIIHKQTEKLKKKRQKTIQMLVQNIIKYTILIIVIAAILKTIGVNVTSIVAGLGVASVILSLALKDIMQDILAGIAIVFEDQFDVGDFVEINGFTGTVIELSLKSTKIKNYKNTVKIISNRLITEVTNYSKENPKITIDIPIPYDVANKKADQVINKIIKRAEKEVETLAGEIELLGLNQFESSQISYRMLITSKMDMQFATERQVKRIIKEEMDKEKISIPFNIVEVKNG